MSKKTYFFCGVGGSGMSALALIFARKGFRVLGSDRSYDRGQSPEKFKALESQGIKLFPQDGSGLAGVDALIVSSAVEDSIPDIKRAKELGVLIRKRADLLAEIFNESKCGISIAGTSGKSTVTGMVATVLAELGLDPTVMNGGLIRNFSSNMRVGAGDYFVTETDESDGSIALYNPAIAVVNNIALDHKALDELDSLFGDFVSRARYAVILNADDQKLLSLKNKAKVPVITYSANGVSADLMARDIKYFADSVSFTIDGHDVRLKQPGLHNVSNALAALAVARAIGLPMEKAIAGLQAFTGIARRFEIIGTKNGVTVIDDFAHNPDKISATLKTLKDFPGRLIVMFQMHGYGPLKLMGKEIAETFRQYLGPEDILLLPEAYYAGGTADRSVAMNHVAEWVGPQAKWFAARGEILPYILAHAKEGDRVVIMGARDDTLSDFAREILSGL